MKKTVGTLIIAAALPAIAASQTTLPTQQAKIATAVRLQGEISLDGKLDDPQWSIATPITDFVQKDPVEGAVPNDKMEVRFLYDDDALYVGTRVISKDPAHIQAPISRRDNINQAEHIWVSLDSYHDRRTAYSFGITASGVRGDWYHPSDSETDIDLSFDPVWQAAADINSTGWTAEMRIPFSQLRFNAADVQHWGLNVDHWIPSRNEDVFWIPVPKKATGWSSRMGALEGIRGIKPARRLEVMPYVASDATVNGERDQRNPFDNGSNLDARVGGDLKMGLGPSLTLAATVNPDFGQVEADPAEVNLSAFETIFPEKRPFFIEGSQLLRGFGPSYFYSRRIGARPRGPASGSFVDYPNATTILGAAKLTGRLANGSSVGGLAAVTGREEAESYDLSTNQFSKVEVAPLTGYGVGRFQKEFGHTASTIGLTLTGMQRDLSASDALSSVLNRAAYSGGVDLLLRLQGGAYQIRSFAGFSDVEGEPAAISIVQTGSAHYFQRPDATSYHFDDTRTSISGYDIYSGIDKVAGKHWLGGAYAGAESPGLDFNDVGRLGTADGQSGGGYVTYRETQPGKRLQRYDANLEVDTERNFDGDKQFLQYTAFGSSTFKNFWVLSLTAAYDVRAQDARLTRGGPSMGTGASNYGIISLGNSSASTTQWQGRVYYGKDEWGAPTNRLSGLLSIRPTPQWQLSAEPNYLRFVDPRQYVTELSGGSAATYGKRYVFAYIDRSTFLTDIRLNYTLKPDVTLEMFVEPFAASGRYYRFGELSAARSRDILRYGEQGTTITQQADKSYLVTDSRFVDSDGKPATFTLPFSDFNVRSILSNMVVRWEYRPGSTFFFVWQQSRQGNQPNGELVRLGDLFGGFKNVGSNFFAIKANFWIPAL
ncbi:MAG: DUF5916 domain-containing protein [Gemmatimonadaceae bacterium]